MSLTCNHTLRHYSVGNAVFIIFVIIFIIVVFIIIVVVVVVDGGNLINVYVVADNTKISFHSFIFSCTSFFVVTHSSERRLFDVWMKMMERRKGGVNSC